MFDKMIDSAEAETRGRSRYFVVSALAIASLFFSAVVASIYAVDLSLGGDQLELSIMLAPVTPEAPEPPQPDRPTPQTQGPRSDVPVRNSNTLRLDESPVEVPDSASVEKPTSLARPYGKFKIDSGAIETIGTGGFNGMNRNPGEGGGEVGSSSSDTAAEAVTTAVKLPEPPPAMKPKVPPVVSKGVINGQAKSLPHPAYPEPARMVGAQGAVSVQITIDESGKVISAKAVNGHPLLKPAAEKAAWQAKFSPTLLSDVPVKVTGVIVYNFKR